MGAVHTLMAVLFAFRISVHMHECHRFDIKHHCVQKPVALHFNLPDHSLENFSFVMEKFQSNGTIFEG